MKGRFHIALVGILALSQWSCEKNNLGTIDSSKDVPLLSNASVTPDSIFIDNLTPVGGTFQISASIRVNASVGSGTNQTVTAIIFRPNSINELQQLTLSPSSGGVYSGQVQFSITRAQAGKYRIAISSRTSDGLVGNSIEMPLKLGRRNSLPLLQNVSMPDSVTLHPIDTLRIQFTATVSDSDGLADIREMFFQRISPPDPTKFQMKDDGNLDPPVEIGPQGGGIFVRSGDDIAGDGRYSFLIPLTPTATRRTNVFRFQAVDSFGDTSASIIDSLVVR
jgi:hypothetical protein